MTVETVTSQVDTDLAQAYHSAPAKDQTKLHLLLNLWLRELFVRVNSVSGRNPKRVQTLMLSWRNFCRRNGVRSIQLSQLGQTSPTAGQPERFSKLTWSEFVQHALESTIKAYQAMLRARIAQPDWEENAFTICLADKYLRPIAFDDEYSIRVETRTKVHTKEMREGRQATSEAKEMDLSVYGVWERDYRRRRFVWEAKRVGDKRVNRKYRILNYEYVHEAIYRFIRGEYADGLSDAGVLGYVLAGSVANMVNDINRSMGRIRKNPPLPKSDLLQLASPVDNFEDVYRSHHTRTNNSKMRLHHLFLTFEFA